MRPEDGCTVRGVRRRSIGNATFSGWVWYLYYNRRHWMQAKLGEWPEELQPTVRKHSSELLLKREEIV